MFIRPRKKTKSGMNRWGAATVEMAMVAPVIIVLVFGSIEFARMMMVRQALTNAAREGCRHACLASTSSDSASIKIMQDTLVGVVYQYDGQDSVRATIEPGFSTVPTTGTKLVAVVEVDCGDVSWLPPMFYAGAKMRIATSAFRE